MATPTSTQFHMQKEQTFLACSARPSPQRSGDDGSAAHAENSPHRHEDQKYRRRQGNSGHQQSIVGLADKKGVRQIVDQDHQHGRHDGKGVLKDRLGYRGFLKNFCGLLIFHKCLLFEDAILIASY